MSEGKTAHRRPVPGTGGQAGHLMAGVMVGIAIMLIFSTLTFQGWENELRRDNEAEMIFRAEEIVRAIVRFRKDKGALPQKLEDLMEPGQKEQYFLRHLYDDPLVKNGKWGLLYAGPGGAIIDPSVEPVAGEGEAGAHDLGFVRERRNRERDREGALAPPAEGQVAGMQIAGVKSLCMDEPFRHYRGLTSYSEWLFTYLDLEMAQVPGQKGNPGNAGRGSRVLGRGPQNRGAGSTPGGGGGKPGGQSPRDKRNQGGGR